MDGQRGEHVVLRSGDGGRTWPVEGLQSLGTRAGLERRLLGGGAPLVPTAAVGQNEWMSLVLNTGAGFDSGDALWVRIETTGYAAWVDYVMVTMP